MSTEVCCVSQIPDDCLPIVPSNYVVTTYITIRLFYLSAGDCSDRLPLHVDQAIVQYIATYMALGATQY
jgi:hypothetical protein